MAGSIIAAALITGLNSDLPGQVVAQVTEDLRHGKRAISAGPAGRAADRQIR
jgi:Bacterial conjugation TrbI-like protein